jgi:hypothetical protein
VARIDPAIAIAERILYIVVLSPEGAGDYSLFQGFSVNTFAAIPVLQHICQLPPTIAELFAERDDAVRMRAIGIGGYAIVMLDLEFLEGFREGYPWTVFVSSAATRDDVERHVQAHGRPGWLHLTTGQSTPSIKSLPRFRRADMFAWSRSVAEQLARARGDDPTKLQWRPFVEWPIWRLRLRSREHRTTEPTEAALRSLGASLTEPPVPLGGSADPVHARAISRAAMTLEGIRSRELPDHAPIPGTPSTIVTVPSVYRHLAIDQLRRDASKGARIAVRNILRQKQYTAMLLSEEDSKHIDSDPFAIAALIGRGQELAAYTAALSVTASSLAAPVLRCPPQVDRIRELLIRLAGVRGDSPGRVERRNELAAAIGSGLRSAVPAEILRHIERHAHEGIKLIGDTPLELLPVGDLPLSLAATTSRLPTLPGNLLMRQALQRTPQFLSTQDLRRVLIVRAFEPGDPLRGMLDIALGEFQREFADRLEVKIVDVSTADEFVTAFNAFDGALAIFDGHGSHERDDPHGTLAVGKLKIDVFAMYREIRVPPIVWLSACETHPLEGVENSVASAFLMMGAKSVLGTNLPVDGPAGAVLVARFLYRLAGFVPILNVPIPWSEVVAGMLRMSYVTDVLRALQEQLRIPPETVRALHVAANQAINTFQRDWFDGLLGGIATAMSTDLENVRALWRRSCYFTDSLRYVHLGTPEHMFVVPDDDGDEETPGAARAGTDAEGA